MILSLLIAAGGCGGDSGTNGGGGGGGGVGPPARTMVVDVLDLAFQPRNIQVPPGATVSWIWMTVVSHNVTFADATITDSPTQAGGTHVAVMPTALGTYTYQCTIHPASMQGSVLVAL